MKLSVVFMLVLGLSAIVMAQSTTTGAIGGVVQNPNKEVVPGAAVTVKNVGTNNINQTSISELPINGRRWSNLALLTPGAVPDGTFGLISFRGISGLLNNNTIDGGDNNQAFFAEERGRTRISYSVSQAAIREFQVNTSSYSAEYGRSAGGVVNAITKVEQTSFTATSSTINETIAGASAIHLRLSQSWLTACSRRLVSSRKMCGTSLAGRSVVQSSKTKRFSSLVTISRSETSRGFQSFRQTVFSIFQLPTETC